MLAKTASNFYKWLTSSKVQEGIGWAMVIISLIGWPISMFTIFKNEPPGILSLSWAALLFSGYSAVVAARADKHIKENNNS